MSSENKTTLGLNQWVDSDIPEMEDFNTDNDIVDTTLVETRDQLAQTTQDVGTIKTYFEGGKAKLSVQADNAKTAENGINNRAFAINTTDWTDSAEFIMFPFEAVIPAAGVVPTDDALVFFAAENVSTAQAAGITSGISKTTSGAIRIFAESVPAQTLSGTYAIIHREV